MDLSKTIQGLPNSAAGYFGSMAESYDSLIHRAVPRYDEMIARLLDYLPGSPRRVLELGCGTGNLSLRLAKTFPLAELTLLICRSPLRSTRSPFTIFRSCGQFDKPASRQRQSGTLPTDPSFGPCRR